jgi:hypothetical protein
MPVTYALGALGWVVCINSFCLPLHLCLDYATAKCGRKFDILGVYH